MEQPENTLLGRIPDMIHEEHTYAGPGSGTQQAVLIVGAGCFGISTAYHLLKRGFKDVTVIDQSDSLPAPDAASTDLNKVVRSSYADGFYSRLAQEAIQSWKTHEWGDTYHESGVLVLGTDTGKDTYANKSYDNDIALGSRLDVLEDGTAIRSVFPQGVRVASFETLSGYLNHDGGWANAAQGVSIMTANVVAQGGKIFTGKRATKLLRQGGQTSGVQCGDGTVFKADLIILAAGSWTASSFSDLNFNGKCIATGQSIATIQLTPDDANIYRKCPVVLDFSTGLYIFPPNEVNLVKFGIHDSGVRYFPVSGQAISVPRTVSSHSLDGLRIPKVKAQELRECVRRVYPELAEKPFSSTRLCWYTDSADEDWVIGYYPSDPSLVIATGGSGHAYKFMPVIGRIVADAVEGTLDPLLVKKFAVDRDCTNNISSRSGCAIIELDIKDLCCPEDLLPLGNAT